MNRTPHRSPRPPTLSCTYQGWGGLSRLGNAPQTTPTTMTHATTHRTHVHAVRTRHLTAVWPAGLRHESATASRGPGHIHRGPGPCERRGTARSTDWSGDAQAHAETAVQTSWLAKSPPTPAPRSSRSTRLGSAERTWSGDRSRRRARCGGRLLSMRVSRCSRSRPTRHRSTRGSSTNSYPRPATSTPPGRTTGSKPTTAGSKPGSDRCAD